MCRIRPKETMTKPRHLTDRELYNNVGSEIRLQKIFCSRGACTFAHRGMSSYYSVRICSGSFLQQSHMWDMCQCTFHISHLIQGIIRHRKRRFMAYFWGPICLSYAFHKRCKYARISMICFRRIDPINC